MEKRAVSGRGEPIPSILKKSKKIRSGDFVDKSTKLKREKNNDKKGDVNVPLPQGCTPLMYACQQANYKSVVDTLNKDPASVRVRDRGLRCALHYCASSGAGTSQAARAACADRVLMAAPALADARDADGLTPLHLAVVHGNVPLVQTLLAAGADVNAKDNEQHTVVHWATVCGEVGALRAVLAVGADAATPDQHGGYPLHYAAQMCGAPAATDHQSRGAALEVLRALVREGGARVDVRDADGRTPLLWAASAGSAAAVLALHQAGASVDDSDRDGLTALHCAAARGHTEALETLVGLCGARVDVADSHGCTPLHYAAALGHADATSALLVHGSDSHRQDRRGRSPAHTAAAKGQIETVRILGARGANLWLRNSKGDLPLHEAVASGRRELVKWLLDGRPSQVNATNHEGRTPLHIAAATDNADLCRLLLDRGAEVNPLARSSKNEPLTPLDCATSRGHRSTAKYLQMHGGLPASKLTNTQIVIDSAQITGLPTRKVTSTKIDVRDRIRIEKREIVELSSPIMDRRKVVSNDRDIDSKSSSSSDYDQVNRKTQKKYSDRHTERRKKSMEKQKSFSDGYDSEYEIEKQKARKHKMKKELRTKKSRSKSEPSRRSKSSPRYHRRHLRSYSESSSESSSYSKKTKSKRNRKRTKQKKSSISSSSSESSNRHTTKRKGKKTSIYIENDEVKQRVNITNYKSVEQTQSNEPVMRKENVENLKHPLETSTDQAVASNTINQKTLSETETDTISVKTNMVITEAQIHMERESSQHGSSELTVTMDSSNNVSIETSNMSVTHKDVNAEVREDDKIQVVEREKDFHIENTLKEESQSKPEDITNTSGALESERQELILENLPKNIDDRAATNQDTSVDTIETKDESQSFSLDLHKESEKNLKETEIKTNSNEEEDKQKVISRNGSSETKRKTSFQVLSGPDENKTESKTDIILDLNVNTKEQAISLDKSSPSVSFSNKDEVFKIKDSENESEQLAGENKCALDAENIETKNIAESGTVLKKEQETSKTSTSSENDAIPDKGIITILDDPLFTNEELQESISQDEQNHIDNDLPLDQISPSRVSKLSKDSQASSRKSSIYETESYKVLSDTIETVDVGSGILKKSKSLMDGEHINNRLRRDSSLGRIPSISDNEIYYSLSEANGRRKRFRKKGRIKSRMTIRSKSENSERGYESSGLLDSGFEPSPRPVQRCIMSPRLNAYYQQRKSARNTSKTDSKIPVRKPGDKRAVDMKSVTQRIQTNMRRYYCERKIFQHLLELKRLQIRTSKANEAVLVKRAIDEYNKSTLSNVGLGSYNSVDYSFSSFEKFLYDSLRKLQKSGKKHLDKLPEKPIDFDYGESELYKMGTIPDNPCLCTSKTHRCFHAVHAYTGIPCSAYIPYKWNHHTMPKPATAGTSKSRGFLPKINSKPPSGKAHVTLEVSHGTEKQLIALPAEKLDRNKRYYVTFTVKGSEPTSDNDNASPKSSKAVRSLD